MRKKRETRLPFSFICVSPFFNARYFGQDRRMLRADRIHLNTLEHMVPFLGMMWLHAVYVDVYRATVLPYFWFHSGLAPHHRPTLFCGYRYHRNRSIAATLQVAGIVGTVARALYPFLLGSWKEGLGLINTKSVYPSTMPQYAVMVYLTLGVFRKLIGLVMYS
mmetsp:Transcript_30624/g.74624  ORF Transcript_30624/g.74624 Transcript_30624/m.74624 type:complete len:163 (+) Transcript_30624:203-691(+)